MVGRPLGSKNKPRVIDADEGDVRNTIDGRELRDYIDRIEQCEHEQKELSSDRQQIFKELRTAGYDRDTVRELIRKRKLTEEQRASADALMAEYLAALGDYAGTPLGRAGADRMRGGEAYAE